MPLPTAANIYAQIRHAISDAFAGRKLGKGRAADSDVASVHSTYGKQLAPFAGAALQALEEGGAAYKGLEVTAPSLRQQIEAVSELGKLRDELLAALDDVSGAYDAARVTLGASIERVSVATAAIRDFPGLDEKLRDRALKAAAGLQKLQDDRRAERSAAITIGLQQKQDRARKEAETSATIESLKSEVEAQALENKFLRRGALQPEDFPPADPAAALRAPTAAAAPRRARRQSRR